MDVEDIMVGDRISSVSFVFTSLVNFLLIFEGLLYIILVWGLLSYCEHLRILPKPTLNHYREHIVVIKSRFEHRYDSCHFNVTGGEVSCFYKIGGVQGDKDISFQVFRSDICQQYVE